MRFLNRKNDELRKVTFTPNVNKYADGSCLVAFGDTKVLCTASYEKKIPSFLKGSGRGWVTAEYGMLPRSTDKRMDREAKKGGQSPRTNEIQRLIARALRSVVNLSKMGGEYQIIVDCDVIQADGGTRTASVCGGFVAMVLAMQKMVDDGIFRNVPVSSYLAAISAGVVGGNVLLDLDYQEDSNCDSDMNFVMNSDNQIIEIQGTAESDGFSFDRFTEVFNVASSGISEIIEKQKEILKGIL